MPPYGLCRLIVCVWELCSSHFYRFDGEEKKRRNCTTPSQHNICIYALSIEMPFGVSCLLIDMMNWGKNKKQKQKKLCRRSHQILRKGKQRNERKGKKTAEQSVSIWQWNKNMSRNATTCGRERHRKGCHCSGIFIYAFNCIFMCVCSEQHKWAFSISCDFVLLCYFVFSTRSMFALWKQIENQISIGNIDFEWVLLIL